MPLLFSNSDTVVTLGLQVSDTPDVVLTNGTVGSLVPMYNHQVLDGQTILPGVAVLDDVIAVPFSLTDSTGTDLGTFVGIYNSFNRFLGGSGTPPALGGPFGEADFIAALQFSQTEALGPVGILENGMIWSMASSTSGVFLA